MSFQSDNNEAEFYFAVYHYWHDVAPYPQITLQGEMDSFSREARDMLFETRSNLVLNGADPERVQYIENVAKVEAQRHLAQERATQ